jgi:hypothetical protein
VELQDASVLEMSESTDEQVGSVLDELFERDGGQSAEDPDDNRQ